jgi:hypothetical protein
LFLSPSAFEASELNEEVSYELKIENVKNLFAWKIGLEWDPEYVEFVEVEEGPFLKDNTDTLWIADPPGEESVGLISCTSFTYWTGYNGSGILASIKMRVIKETAETTIILTNTEIRNHLQRGLGPESIIEHEVKNAKLSLLGEVEVIAHAGDDTTEDEGIKVTLNGTKSSGDGLSYKWRFDDHDGPKELSGEIAEYTFAKPGRYIITLTASKDDKESNDTVIIDILDVTPPIPKIEIEGIESDKSAEVNIRYTFNASSSYDPENGTISKYYWDFGDNSTSTNKIIAHAYEAPGEYTIKLNITDTTGNTAQENFDVFVYDVAILESTGPDLISILIIVLVTALSIYGATVWII